MTTLWHLAEPADWALAQAVGSYEGSTRGASLAEVGFVHCSYPEQLPLVVAVFYADVVSDYVILELDRERLEAAGSPVRDEPGARSDPSAPLFPHIYGPVPLAAVTRVLAAHLDHGSLTIEPAP